MRFDKLTPKLKKDILSRNLPIGQLKYLDDWPLDLIKLTLDFKLGYNKTLQLMNLLKDASLNSGKPVDEPLKSPEWTDIYNNSKMTMYQKGLRLRQFLLTKRYPVYMELRDKIKKILKKFNLPKNISIDNEILSLEKNTITFKVECRHAIDLKNTAQKLMEISDSDELKNLLDLLKM